MTDTESTREKTGAVSDDAVVSMRHRLGKLDPRQVAVWRAMSPAQRLELALRPYQFALDAVRTTEKQRRAGGTGLARHAADAGGSNAGQVKVMEQLERIDA